MLMAPFRCPRRILCAGQWTNPSSGRDAQLPRSPPDLRAVDKGQKGTVPMAPTSHPLLLRAATRSLAVAMAVLATLVSACGDDDDGDKSSSSATSAASQAVASGPGTITVTSSSPISGQNNKVLLIYASPEAGGALNAEACVQIRSDRQTVPPTAMTDKKGDQAPCSSGAAKTTFPEGTYTVTAGIYAPPAQAPEKEIKLSVKVSGNVTVQIDGAALSR